MGRHYAQIYRLMEDHDASVDRFTPATLPAARRPVAISDTNFRRAAVAANAIAAPAGVAARAAAGGPGAGAAGPARHSRQAAAASPAHRHTRGCRGWRRGRAPHLPPPWEGAAPARLAAWCIGRAPHHGRPPRTAGESTRRAPGTRSTRPSHIPSRLSYIPTYLRVR
jgi:hypothetical protein